MANLSIGEVKKCSAKTTPRKPSPNVRHLPTLRPGSSARASQSSASASHDSACRSKTIFFQREFRLVQRLRIAAKRLGAVVSADPIPDGSRRTSYEVQLDGRSWAAESAQLEGLVEFLERRGLST